jgi:hypothetical protein
LKGELSLRDSDAFSTEQMCINGPCARSDHRERNSQRREHHLQGRTPEVKKEKAQFRNCHDQAGNRRPKANDQ